MAGKNQGEGNREAAQHYNKETREFVESGKVDQAAKDAKKAYEGPEKDELKKAEEAGKSHSHGEDPQVKR